MKVFGFQGIMTGILATGFIICGYYVDKKENSYYNSKEYKDSIYIPEPPGGDYSNVRCWNFQEKRWEFLEPIDTVPKPIYYPKTELRSYSKPKLGKYPRRWSRNYSDEEIRILREKQSFSTDGSYIYTPGRHVPTRKELSREEIEDYIDKHGEEIYRELEDKYGN